MRLVHFLVTLLLLIPTTPTFAEDTILGKRLPTKHRLIEEVKTVRITLVIYTAKTDCAEEDPSQIASVSWIGNNDRGVAIYCDGEARNIDVRSWLTSVTEVHELARADTNF